jgi:hypothetical protein
MFNVYQRFRYCNQLSQSQALSLLWDAKFIPHLKERVFFRGIDKLGDFPVNSDAAHTFQITS